jgi:hypothetical protein
MIATSPSSSGRSDDFDRVLGDFFRAEVPAPWPNAPMPVRSVHVLRQPSVFSGGRVALAASVAALLLGSWFLSGRLPSPATPGSLDDSKATLPSTLGGGPTAPINPRP